MQEINLKKGKLILNFCETLYFVDVLYINKDCYEQHSLKSDILFKVFDSSEYISSEKLIIRFKVHSSRTLFDAMTHV